jgi:hypothetical protein
MWHTRFLENAWLSQASHIFSRFGITSNFEDYGNASFVPLLSIITLISTVFVRGIFFNVQISASQEDPPLGYLFLCPWEDLQVGPFSFCLPACAAYWSLDPSGTERLSTEESQRLGFPSIQFTIDAQGFSWDASIYAGLRQFHLAKGFDPESQDVARHLLYQLSHEVDSLFAHGNSLPRTEISCST